jgi:cytochrome P450
MRLALNALLERLPDLRLATGGPVQWQPSLASRSPLRLDIEHSAS